MCKKNGKYHRAECVHHIKEVKPHPFLSLTINNLMCLCKQCHNKVHDRMAEHMKKKENHFMNEERW
ncbi:HNH endonuclease [Paenisporosarcina macmurdoensis]|uniref:HNH endonuclease n=1 Tax=Paenisporosarcina macmurdoensis TaxID=212659 RepID=A0ABW1L312_9BACL